MGNNCSNCCTNIEKKLKLIEDENELKIHTTRQMNHNNLSMIVEDAYESQLSQQNSHLGLSMQIQSNTINSITTGITPNTNPNNNNNNPNLINFWILDIQERLIIVSNVNEPNLLMKISVSFNEQTEEYSLFEEISSRNSNNSTNSSLNSIHNVKNSTINTNNNNNNSSNKNVNNNSSCNNLSMNNNSKFNNNLSGDATKYIQNKKYSCFPFERQISQFYQLHFEKWERKMDRINDFQTLDEMQFNIVETWQEILQQVFKIAGIQQNSNLIIINNFLRFTRQTTQLNHISEILLKYVFEKLKAKRFTICSSGVPILKFINRKNGIVFDILDSGFVYCLPICDGQSLDARFRIIYYYASNIRNETADSNLVAINSATSIPAISSSPPQNNNNNNGCMQQNKKLEFLQKDIIEFLDSLEPEFMKSCFRSHSIAVNNQSKNETIISNVLHILNQYYLQTTRSTDDNTILTTFQPVIPKHPRTTRIYGALDLVKLNVIETISKSKFERLGAVEIFKQNVFL